MPTTSAAFQKNNNLMKITNTIKSIFVCLLLCLVPQIVCAMGQDYRVWDGSSTSEPQPWDNGTDFYDYIINEAAELAWITQNNDAQSGFAGKRIYLNVSVDLAGHIWTPIGSAEHPFEGDFHGGYCLVKGVRICRGTDGVGLFGHVSSSGYIHEMGVSCGDMTVSSKRRVGTFAGVCDGRIEKVWSMASVMSAGNVVGGLVGELGANGSITDAFYAGLILQARDTLGAIVGYNNGGSITRTYSVGYAKNGNGFVGVDNSGQYADCYYDRKLYYQEPGYVGAGLTPVDKSEDMYYLFNGNPDWYQDGISMPRLYGMDDMDEAGVATLPILVDTTSTEPVNHANDLTLDFQIAQNGPVICNYRSLSDTTWLSFDPATYKMTVTRPCAETDILINLNYEDMDEYRVVYFRPRRLEDLLAGKFDSRKVGFCLNTEEQYGKLSSYVAKQDASRGWVDGEYHYMVVRYGIVANDTVPLDTVVIADTQTEYDNWFNNYVMKTDSAGEFFLREFVHDDGCIKDWIPAEGQFPYTVFEEFDPGKIESGIDTLYLDPNPQLVSVESVRAASGGNVANLHYDWYLNGEYLNDWTEESIIDYPITTAGTYVFNRWAGDGECSDDYVNLSDSGEYTFEVFDPLDPGEVSEIDNLVFCTLEDAQAHIIEATAATGGSGHYEYQWYLATATDTTLIENATSQNFDLSTYPMNAGESYTFVRKAKDNTRFTQLTLSRKQQSLSIKAVLTAGAIENETRDKICIEENDNTATVKISEVTAATGDAGMEYQWWQIYGNDSTVVGSENELDYTVTVTDEMLDKTYKYVREVRYPDCEWLRSEGAVLQYFGKVASYSKSFTVCEDLMPYTMAWYDSDHVRYTYQFTQDGESHAFRDEAGTGCPVDSVFTIHVEKAPSITVPSQSSVCLSTGNIYIDYSYETAGETADMFYITYSPDLAGYIGRNDTTGYVTSDGLIVLRNIQNVGTGNIYLDLQVGNSGGATLDEGVCLGQRHRITLDISLDGYVHTMHDRIIFIDNNPRNGEVEGDKLKFVAYQWYKNGVLQEGQTGQYYHEGGKVLDGVFYAMLTDNSGVSYRSCDVTVVGGNSSAPALRSSIYPMPVNGGEQFTIDCVEGSATIVSSTGVQVERINKIVGKASVKAPLQAGWYYVRVVNADGSMDTHKLIVK